MGDVVRSPACLMRSHFQTESLAPGALSVGLSKTHGRRVPCIPSPACRNRETIITSLKEANLVGFEPVPPAAEPVLQPGEWSSRLGQQLLGCQLVHCYTCSSPAKPTAPPPSTHPSLHQQQLCCLLVPNPDCRAQGDCWRAGRHRGHCWPQAAAPVSKHETRLRARLRTGSH